ncbi:hypothetical protein [Burkholderia ubonensis]|uniref:hypothetical protein n=1 Tax=Burkholderia ubonensis TaxID=101571 RepID=UPI00075CD6B7|nr:hypothetical protein [Burkholderia ubonensis]KVU50969.1 hypothetical protein WK69_07060 [Burkholderia ubonensis]KVU91346.1 hypothetical protein WK75_17065 [Burkholderia ubonensis]KWD06239.1 hypothetical protein WL59_08950 [Burkholderia ubonensis]
MAGDLLIIDMPFETKATFQAAGATVEQKIFHSDRSWGTNRDILEQRLPLTLAGPANRAGLPAHAYVIFAAAKRQQVATYCANPVQMAKLNNHLVKLCRPLRVVTANPHLAQWPGVGVNGAANLLLAALNQGNVVVEYYKQDGSPVIDVFGKTWQLNQE